VELEEGQPTVQFEIPGVAFTDPADLPTITFEDPELKLATDFFSFGFTDSGASVKGIANQIIRLELEETGDNTGVFEGTLEYVMINQMNSLDLETYTGLSTIADDPTFIVIEDLTDEDAPRVTYGDLDAQPTKSGVVSFDLSRYKITDTVTVTLEDADLNLDSDLIDIYTIVGDVTVFGKTGFTLTEIGPDTGIFLGDFAVPTEWVEEDVTGPPLGGYLSNAAGSGVWYPPRLLESDVRVLIPTSPSLGGFESNLAGPPDTGFTLVETPITIDYGETPGDTIVREFGFAAIDIEAVDDEWGSGEEIPVTLVDVDAPVETEAARKARERDSYCAPWIPPPDDMSTLCDRRFDLFACKYLCEDATACSPGGRDCTDIPFQGVYCWECKVPDPTFLIEPPVTPPVTIGFEVPGVQIDTFSSGYPIVQPPIVYGEELSSSGYQPHLAQPLITQYPSFYQPPSTQLGVMCGNVRCLVTERCAKVNYVDTCVTASGLRLSTSWLGFAVRALPPRNYFTGAPAIPKCTPTDDILSFFGFEKLCTG